MVDLCPSDDTLSVYNENAPSVIAPLIIKDAVGLPYCAVGPEVRKQGERQVTEAAGELVQRWTAVYGNPQDLRILTLILFPFRTEGRKLS